VIDLKILSVKQGEVNIFEGQKSSLIVQEKASVYLIFVSKIKRDKHLVFFRLLAFTPHLKTPYLKEYSFLPSKLLSNSLIDFRDFREDVSGSEKFFARHEDEYIGQPSLQDEVQTIFFPLRNQRKRIVATVTLSSPSLSAKLSAQKETILLFIYLTLGISLVFLFFYSVKNLSLSLRRKYLTLIVVIAILLALRALFFPLSQLEKIQSLSCFSPAVCSFFSFLNLTKSPADIFLTSLFLFLIILSLRGSFRNLYEQAKKRWPSSIALGAGVGLISFTIFLLFIFQEILSRLVFHSNINLLNFPFQASFFLLQLSIFLFFLSFYLAILTVARIVFAHTRSFILPFLIFVGEFGLYVLLFRERIYPLVFPLQACVILSALILASFPQLIQKKEALFIAFLLNTLFICVSLQIYTSQRNHNLIEHSLQNIIKSQERWGNFLIEQSLSEIDKRDDIILSFFQREKSGELARSLWERTLIAKFNWYSSLEILNPDGALLSRFSLNVPSLFRLDYSLPLNPEWFVLSQSVPFMGKEKDFLIAYKDWFGEGNHLGRMILYLSIDYEMLPFLYSANPYFELLRVSSVPSLDQFDFRFAIFDEQARLVFNPNRISSGIPPQVFEKIKTPPHHLWSQFRDRDKRFECFYFRNNNKIYSLFLPAKNFFDYSVRFLKLFFLYLVFSGLLFGIISLSLKKGELRSPFWSFSNRVYISFFAVAIIPLLLFTFFTRSFFSRIFAQQFREKAEIHANLAQRVMEDFEFFQEEEQLTPALPPDNVVLWISTTISNDVNLYQQGKLISSSRREFFDYGLLPELIDGEVYYRIQHENNPLYTQTQKIGGYSFQTLTIPYSLGPTQLLISLPFPLEQQEISEATGRLIEFLFFISVFFIAAVLFLARGLGGMIITPIRKLLKGTKEVSLGNLGVSISHKSEDEMKTLIDGFNSMVKNLKKHQQELAEMSKKVAWAEMARKVAHEIKNPLTPIQLSAEHILRVYEDKPEELDRILKESASYIIKEVENLRKIAHEFLDTSKEPALRKERIDLGKLIRETVSPYRKILSERIAIQESYKGEDFWIWGDKDKLKIALRNILTNAIEAIQNQGEIKIIARQEKESLKLEIEDTGMGMNQDLVDRIFDPYFSTKDVGTGLGLPIAKKIVESHGGKIEVFSRENKGTRISIDLPR
jgi:signal transduction histidine kinase